MATTTAQQNAAAALAAKNQQIADAKAKLASVNTKLATVQTPTAQTYLNASGAAEVKDTAIANYTDTYNKYFDKYKNIAFSVGTAAQPSSAAPAERAFYTFNAGTEAQKSTDSDIAATTQQHNDYLGQQEKIKQFIANQQSQAANQAFDMYFNDHVASTAPQLNNGVITSDSPLFDTKAFMRNPNRKTIGMTVYDPVLKKSVYKQVYSYKDQAAAQSQLASMRDVLQNNFNSSKDLQTTWLSNYTNSLVNQQKNLQRQLNRLT
jgi:hypothetical protein